MKTGSLFVFGLTNFKFSNVVTVKLMFLSNLLNIGSTPYTLNLSCLVQN
jgi:hypothetical protein